MIKKLILGYIIFCLVFSMFPSIVNDVGANGGGPPTVATNDATNVLNVSVTLNGDLIATGGYACTCSFQYGFTTSYGTNSDSQVLYTTDTYSDSESGLTPSKIYHFRAKAVNAEGTSYGSDKSFLTKPTKPSTFLVDYYNRTAMNLSWTNYSNSNSTVIVRKLGSYPTSVSDGTLVYNGTLEVYNDTSLSAGTKYYYSAFSYVTLVSLYKFSAGAQTSNTTESNVLPQFNNESISPVSGNLTTMFYLNTSLRDTDDGDPDEMRVNISVGSTYVNKSMTWVEGSNLTGANYTYSNDSFSVGTWAFYFLAYDGHAWNSSGPHYIYVNSNITFSLNFPVFLEVGQYLSTSGTIKNVTNFTINQVWVHTKIIDSGDSWTTVPQSSRALYVTNGYYTYDFSTTTMTPGIYNILVNFTQDSISYSSNWTFYLSLSGGPGHFATTIYFNFYHGITGGGLSQFLFKIFVSTDTSITDDERIYNSQYRTYTGATIYYKVNDYFDNQVYPTTGSYQTFIVTDIEEGVDIPISWYDLSIKNLNQTIMHFSMNNGSRYYNITLFPMDSVHINVLGGDYDITLDFYSAMNGSHLKTVADTISVIEDTFYIATGYNAMVHVSWYNTNDALGLPDETLKLYFNDNRQTSQTYWTHINATIKVTIKDYYNQILYSGNHTITNQYTFLDFGLTFHSYKFCNKNEEYYMISFLKFGGTRWYERAVCPYETIEYLLPSGANYTLRIYNATYVELYNETIDVRKSMVYEINGSFLSTVIEGQSVIVGQLLEILEEYDYLTQGDIVQIVLNIPYIYSTYDVQGQILGMNTIKVCPAQILTGTATNTTSANTSSSALIPTTTTANGTITVMKDTLYFQGPSNISWVNVSYTNGTLIQNTSYIPSHLELWGAVIQVNSSNGELTIKRETRFQQIKKFYWTKYTDTAYYTATVDFTNPLNSSLTEAYLYIEFANDTTPEYNGVVVYDVTNGVWLTNGENFDASASGVHMAVISIAGNGSRSFTLNYYGEAIDVQTNDAVVALDDFGEMKTHNDKNYYYLLAQWINDKDRYFIGELTIAFNFTTKPYEIASESIDIFDMENSRYLRTDEYSFSGNSIDITQDTIGSVAPDGARTFEIYYLYISEEVEPEVLMQISGWLDTPWFPLPILPGGFFRVFHLVVIILGLLGFIPLIVSYQKHKSLEQVKKTFFKYTIFFIAIITIVVIGFINAGGVI